MSIVKKKDAEKIVFDFVPKEFPVIITKSAEDFVNKQLGKSEDFEISPIVAEQVGIAEMNRQKIEARVEADALDRLKEVEEKAYEEAYKLGLEEGREEAFKAHNEEFLKRLDEIDKLLKSFDEIKTEIFEQNESHLIRLVYEVASRIAMKEIENNKENIIEVIKNVIHEAQTDENVVIQLSREDFKFIEELRNRQDRSVDFLKQVKVELSDNVQSGGCLLESDYGTINATIQKRVEKAWENLRDKLPHLKADKGPVLIQPQDEDNEDNRTQNSESKSEDNGEDE